MSRTIAFLSAATLLAAGAPVLLAAPASADTPNCVSRAEYRSVKNGWTRVRVARTFDVGGRNAGVEAPHHARHYNDCWRSNRTTGNVSVFYKRSYGAWRVVDKTAEFWHP